MHVRNISERSHRLYWAARHRYLTWGPGQTLELPDDIGRAVCAAHPDKMTVLNDDEQRLPQAMDRRQRGGQRRGRSGPGQINV